LKTTASTSRELVVYQPEKPLLGYDYLLMGTTAAGALLMVLTPATWIGAAIVAASLANGYQRGTTRVIATTGALVAYAVAQPAQALALGGAAASAAFAASKDAIELSQSVVGVLVTTSGAVVGYLVLDATTPSAPKKKRKIKH
jgi:hypothetical protein